MVYWLDLSLAKHEGLGSIPAQTKLFFSLGDRKIGFRHDKIMRSCKST